MTGFRAAKRALVVDDNLNLADNIAEYLESQGFETDVAGSAEEALPLVGAAMAEVVITDFRLPGMNGADLLMRLRQDRRPFRALVISAYNDKDTLTAARAAGAEFLAKPFDLATLGRLIRREDLTV